MFDPEIDQTTEESEKDQVKEFLSRAEIKTMRKDLQKLREAVALQERERIIRMKTGSSEVTQTSAERTTSPIPSLIGTKIFQQKSKEEQEAIEQIKEYTQEPEKEKIFFLEAQKVRLQKDLEALEKQKEPPLILEKNKLALKRDEIQKKLKVFLDKEKRVEDEEKLISESEKSATLPSDRQKLEKKRWAVEEKRQEAEKKSWAIERELQNTEEQLKLADEECRKVVEQINELKNKLAGNAESLRSVYAGVMAREGERIAREKEKKDIESLKQAAQASKMKEAVMEQQWSGRKEASGLSFLDKLPEDARRQRLKQRIQGTAEQEEDQRRKFLENVEKWSEERGKTQDNKN